MASKPDGNPSIKNGLRDRVNRQKMSPSQSDMSTEEDKDLVSATLEACLKLALNKKSASEENAGHLQRELDNAKERIKKLEHVVRARTSKVKQFAKSLSTAESDREGLRNELKLSQQQLNRAMEKNSKLQGLYTGSLKVKNDRVKELEKENQVLRSSRASSPSYSRLPLESSNVSSVYSSRENIFVRQSSIASLDPHTSTVFTSGSITPAESSEQFDWDPYFGGLKVSQLEVEEMVEDYEKLQQSYTESLRVKNERIKQLEENFDRLKSRKYSPTSFYSNASSECSFSTRQSEDFSSHFCSQDFESVTSPTYSANTMPIFEQETQIHKIKGRRYSSRSMGGNREEMKYRLSISESPRDTKNRHRLSLHSKSNSYDLSAHSTCRAPEAPTEDVPEATLGYSNSITPTTVNACNTVCNGAGFLDNGAFRNHLHCEKKRQQEETLAPVTLTGREVSGLAHKMPENVTDTCQNSSEVPSLDKTASDGTLHCISYSKPPIASKVSTIAEGKSVVKVSAEINKTMDLSSEETSELISCTTESIKSHDTKRKKASEISRNQEVKSSETKVTQEVTDAITVRYRYKTRRERAREANENDAKTEKVNEAIHETEEEANKNGANMDTEEPETEYKTRQWDRKVKNKGVEREMTKEHPNPRPEETLTSPELQLVSEQKEKSDTELCDTFSVHADSSRKTAELSKSHTPSPKESISGIPDLGGTAISKHNSCSELATKESEMPPILKPHQTQSGSTSPQSSVSLELSVKESAKLFQPNTQSSSKYHSALLSHGGLMKVAESVPQWKKKLIEKRKLLGPSSGLQAAPIKTEKDSAEPEWKKEILARRRRKVSNKGIITIIRSHFTL